MRLLDPRLRRILDSSDICQSVLASFFLRAAAGQYDLEDAGALLRLLVSMARKKTADASRRQLRQRRDVRRAQAFDGHDPQDRSVDSPSQLVALKEIQQRIDCSFSEEERCIAAMRRDGLTWQEIAERMGGTADARRIQMNRAAERVCQELGLEEQD